MLAVIIILVIINILTAGLVFKKYFPSGAGRLASSATIVRTAAHEAGHAVVALQSMAVHSVSEISILDTPDMRARGSAGVTYINYNVASPFYLWERIIVLMGGAAGEMYYCGTMHSGGCKKDLVQALDYARQMSSKSYVTGTKGEFPFDVAACFSKRPTPNESYILNTAYAEARKRVHNKSAQLKTIAIDLLRVGKLLGHELPRV